ncbi:MAG: MFS transporter [Desulfobacterales bacterium]|nr:MFS transporter [Desulfobacterales bacterium]
MSSSSAPPPLPAAWFVWGLGALFYLMAMFHRVAPAVMTEALMREFHLGAGALGGLAAFYFYSYVAMQVPTGVLTDTLGPRRLLGAGALVAVLGTVLFAMAPTFFWAAAGRLLIGGSVAVAFVSLLKLATNWFPPRFYAMVSGMAVLCGIGGAVFAGTPLRLLMDRYGWRSVLLIVAAATFAVGVAIWIWVRDYPHEKGHGDWLPRPAVRARVSLKTITVGIREVYRYRNTLLLMAIPGAMTGSMLTFAGLWGVPYLSTHHGLPPARAALVTSAMMVSLALGSPFFGWLSDRLGRRKPLYILGCALTLAGWVVAFYIPGIPLAALVAILLITAFSSSSMIVTFSIAKESVPERLSGTISGVANMGVMSGPMLMQPAVGWVLDQKWQGQMADGVRLYGIAAYQAGFGLMLAWMALALVLLFFVRETHCRQMIEKDER